MRVEAKYYDGKSSKEHRVTLNFFKNKLNIEEFNLNYSLNDITISSRLGNTPRVIKLNNGAVLKVEDNDKIDTILNEIGYSKNPIHKLESSNKFAFFSVVAIVFAVVFFLTIGADYSANALSKIIPEDSLDYVSKKALAKLDEKYLHKSNLTKEKKAIILKEFKLLTNNNPRYHLYFRSAPLFGPNAFAMPSGDIVIFDQLVILDKDPQLRGVLGVLAHEKGHIVYKHSLKEVIKGSVAAAVVSYISGDLSFLSTTIPTLLITTGYTRAYEEEADKYAKQELKRLNISSIPLAKLFENMENYSKDKNSSIKMPSWASTHPSTKDRIEFFKKD